MKNQKLIHILAIRMPNPSSEDVTSRSRRSAGKSSNSYYVYYPSICLCIFRFRLWLVGVYVFEGMCCIFSGLPK